MDRTRASQKLAILAVACLLFAACGSAPATPAASAASASPAASPGGPLPKLTIPAPPTAAVPPAGSIDDQAAALAKAVEPGGQAALAPLVAAYQAAGIPIIGDDGHPIPGSAADQVGPGWWQVWLSAGSNPQFAISLSDTTKLLIAMKDAPALDTGALATAGLADLRSMAADSDPHRHFFARFLADLSADRSGVDPLAAATTADAVELSPIAVEFFMAGVTRSIAISAASSAPASIDSDRRIASIGQPLPQGQPALADGAPTGNACNPTGDNDAISYWSQWIASKLAGGLNLPGMESGMKSLTELVVSNAALASKAAKAAAVLGGAISALTFLLEMATLDVSINTTPNPVIRTKETSPGEQGLITATLKYDLGKSSLDGGAGIKNCLLIMANALGIQAALPADGGVVGARLKFLGEDGFNQKLVKSATAFVEFPQGATEITQDTGDGGIANIHVQGMAQKKKIPDSAVEWPREPTVRIYAQPEAENARSLASTFWDSFVAAGAGPVGPVAPIIDILKGVMFDLGEYSFLVTDWQVGWAVKATDAGTAIKGTKCDGTDGEWLLTGGFTQTGLTNSIQFKVEIAQNSTEGTYEYSSNNVVTTPQGTIVATVNGKGSATITLQKDGTVLMKLGPTNATGTSTVGGHTATITLPLPGWTFNWVPQTCDTPPA